MQKLEDIIIVCGHYGSGKTNFSLNLGLYLKSIGKNVDIADMDIVNPYFRTADFAEKADSFGINLILPPYANTNLDIPVVTGAVDSAIANSETLILDVGGDDSGAKALGRYAEKIKERGYSMLYVMNFYRPMTQNAQEMVSIISEIEQTSRLNVTHVINNSNLGYATLEEDIWRKTELAQEVSGLTGLPIWATIVDRKLKDNLNPSDDIFFVDRFVKTLWNN